MARTLSLFTFKFRSGRRVLPQRREWREGALFSAQDGRAGKQAQGGAGKESFPAPSRDQIGPSELVRLERQPRSELICARAACSEDLVVTVDRLAKGCRLSWERLARRRSPQLVEHAAVLREVRNVDKHGRMHDKDTT